MQEEITRLARREALKVEKGLKKTNSLLRQENASLKKRVRTMEKAVATLQKTMEADKPVKKLPTAEEAKAITIQPRSIAAMRKKHGLSILKMAELLNVNHKSLATWEKGTRKPTADSLKKLIAFKNMGKREVGKMLEKPAAKAPVKKTAPKKKVVKKAAAPKKATAPRKRTTKVTATRKKTAKRKASSK
jgi:DNA-binding transcriptional regulator YiaG